MKTDYTLIGGFVDLPEHECSGRVCAVLPRTNTAMLCMNWQEMDDWRAARPAPSTKIPEVGYISIPLDSLNNIVTDTPKYPPKTLAILTELGIVTSMSEGGNPKTTVQSAPTKPVIDNEGVNDMTRTAVFTKESRNLINVYPSTRAAKTAHKGDKEVEFLTEKDFPAVGGFGEFETVTDLFPPQEAKVKAPRADGEKRTRKVIKRTGAYTVVKAEPTTYPEGDERIAILSAILNNTTVEDFLAAAPEVAKYTSTRGNEQSTTAKSYLAYAFKRGWIKQEGVDERAEEVEEQNNEQVEEVEAA